MKLSATQQFVLDLLNEHQHAATIHHEPCSDTIEITESYEWRKPVAGIRNNVKTVHTYVLPSRTLGALIRAGKVESTNGTHFYPATPKPDETEVGADG